MGRGSLELPCLPEHPRSHSFPVIQVHRSEHPSSVCSFVRASGATLRSGCHVCAHQLVVPFASAAPGDDGDGPRSSRHVSADGVRLAAGRHRLLGNLPGVPHVGHLRAPLLQRAVGLLPARVPRLRIERAGLAPRRARRVARIGGRRRIASNVLSATSSSSAFWTRCSEANSARVAERSCPVRRRFARRVLHSRSRSVASSSAVARSVVASRSPFEMSGSWRPPTSA